MELTQLHWGSLTVLRIMLRWPGRYQVSLPGTLPLRDDYAIFLRRLLYTGSALWTAQTVNIDSAAGP